MKFNLNQTNIKQLKWKKINFKKWHKKQLKSNWANLLNTILKLRNRDNLIESKQNKLWSLIHNQPNIKIIKLKKIKKK
jgi:hypothetical protein